MSFSLSSQSSFQSDFKGLWMRLRWHIKGYRKSLLKKQKQNAHLASALGNLWINTSILWHCLSSFLNQHPPLWKNEPAGFKHKHLLQLLFLFFCATGLLLTSDLAYLLAVNKAWDGRVSSWLIFSPHFFLCASAVGQCAASELLFLRSLVKLLLTLLCVGSLRFASASCWSQYVLTQGTSCLRSPLLYILLLRVPAYGRVKQRGEWLGGAEMAQMLICLMKFQTA